MEEAEACDDEALKLENILKKKDDELEDVREEHKRRHDELNQLHSMIQDM